MKYQSQSEQLKLSVLIVKLEKILEHYGDIPTDWDFFVSVDGDGNESIIFEQEQIYYYYIESVIQTERGWFAIIMKYGIDGNFADVYGESEGEAYQSAVELIGDRYEQSEASQEK